MNSKSQKKIETTLNKIYSLEKEELRTLLVMMPLQRLAVLTAICSDLLAHRIKNADLEDKQDICNEHNKSFN